MLNPIFDDVTLCKHITAEGNAFIVFNSFSYMNKTRHFSGLYCYRSDCDFDYKFAVR